MRTALAILLCGTTVFAQRGALVLEDFQTDRMTPASLELWYSYFPGDALGSYVIDTTNHWYRHNLDPTMKMITQFMPVGSSNQTTLPEGRLRYWIKSGTWTATVNRLRFWAKCDADFLRGTTDITGATVEVGTYVKDNTGTWANDNNGDHYYHQIAPNMYANKWVWFELNAHPQHGVSGTGEDGNGNLSVDPSWTGISALTTPTHYFDGFNRMYFDTIAGYDTISGHSCYFADYTMDTETNEPDYEVSSIQATYNGTAYEVFWAGPRSYNHNFTVKYSTSSIRSAGWANVGGGTTVAGPDSAYPNMMWTSPATAQQSQFFVGIMPSFIGGSSNTTVFTEIQVDTGPNLGGAAAILRLNGKHTSTGSSTIK